MKRTKTPWMKADDFGRSLPRGVGLNLLVADIAAMTTFCREALAARIVHEDEDFAVAEIVGSLLLIHADQTYFDHPLSGIVAGATARGVGVEIRVYGADPDAAENAARDHGHIVLAGSVDKPHGLRECHIVAPEGYIFVPCATIGANETKT